MAEFKDLTIVEVNNSSLVLNDATTEVQLFKSHIQNSNLLRQTLMSLTKKVPPDNLKLVETCKEIDKVLEDLLTFGGGELSSMLSIVRDVNDKLRVMFQTKQFNSKFAWTSIKRTVTKMNALKFSPLTVIKFGDGSEVGVQNLFVKQTQALMEYSGHEAISSLCKQHHELQEARMKILGAMTEISENKIVLENKIDQIGLLKLEIEKKIYNERAETEEDKKDREILSDLRDKIRAIDLQIKKTYQKPSPVVVAGIEVFIRFVTVSGNDPELEMQRAELQKTIDRRVSENLKRHDKAKDYEGELKKLENEVNELTIELKKLDQKLKPSVGALAENETKMNTLTDKINKIEKTVNEPISLVRDISESALALKTLISSSKGKSINVFNTVYQETSRLLEDINDFCDAENKDSEIEFLRNIYDNLKRCHDLICILQFNNI